MRCMCFLCDENSNRHLLYEYKLSKQNCHIVNRPLSENIQLVNIVFGKKLTSDVMLYQ